MSPKGGQNGYEVTEPATESAEVWRDIDGANARYSVSSLGRVRSNRSARILKPCGVAGYPTIKTCENGVGQTRYVHDLVCEAFLGPRSCKKSIVVNHKNGVRDDNRLENLEYCTPKDNIRHAVATGLITRQLSRQTAREILAAQRAGESYQSLCLRFGVSKQCVSSLKHGQSYQWAVNPTEYDKALASKVAPP